MNFMMLVKITIKFKLFETLMPKNYLQWTFLFLDKCSQNVIFNIKLSIGLSIFLSIFLSICLSLNRSYLQNFWYI